MDVRRQKQTRPPWFHVYEGRVRRRFRRERLLFRPGSGVEVQVGGFGFLLGYVGVDLGGGGAGVAQQFLDYPQVGLALQHMAGKAVPQGVGMNAVPQTGLGGVVAHQLFDAAAGQPFAIAVEEQGLRRAV